MKSSSTMTRRGGLTQVDEQENRVAGRTPNLPRTQTFQNIIGNACVIQIWNQRDPSCFGKNFSAHGARLRESFDVMADRKHAGLNRVFVPALFIVGPKTQSPLRADGKPRYGVRLFENRGFSKAASHYSLPVPALNQLLTEVAL